MSWDEIDALTIGRLVYELGGESTHVDGEQARRSAAIKVFDTIRQSRGLSIAELGRQPIQTLVSWIAELTGKMPEAGILRQMLSEYVSNG